MLNQKNNLKIILFLVVFIVLILPMDVHADRGCSHCWCLRPDNICEHHTKEDGTTGNEITMADQCSSYCYSRTTDGEHWRSIHCDDHWIDWNNESTDPCFTKTASTDEEGAATIIGSPVSPIEPVLQVPDLNIKFSDIIVSDEPGGQYITVSWLAEYIAAIYQYLVGAATILAIVMIMYGGFRWITAAGDAGKIGEAKKTIVGAVIGLILALGSYTILNLINPDLVSFKSLRLALIERDEFDEILIVTKKDTTDPEVAIISEALPPGPLPTFDSCPVTLEEPYLPPELKPNAATEPRTEEFKAKILPLVAGKSTREKVVDLAQAASLCGVTMGSCGKTVMTINSLAGISGRGAKRPHTISKDQMQYLSEINCSKGSQKSCYSNAKNQAYTKFANEIPGWPDSWANELQAGDAFTVFNGNSSKFGTHAAIFMGWQGNWAKIVQGSYGKDVRTGKICIKSGCANPTPLVRTFKPE